MVGEQKVRQLPLPPSVQGRNPHGRKRGHLQYSVSVRACHRLQSPSCRPANACYQQAFMRMGRNVPLRAYLGFRAASDSSSSLPKDSASALAICAASAKETFSNRCTHHQGCGGGAACCKRRAESSCSTKQSRLPQQLV